MTAVTRLKPELPPRPEVWIPESVYLLRFLYHATLLWKPYRSRGKPMPKVVLGFEVADGEFIGTPLHRYYNVAAVEGHELMNGQFTAPHSSRSRIVADCRRLNGWKPGPVNLDFLKGRSVDAEIRTVMSGFREGRQTREELPEWKRYSTVSRLIRVRREVE